MTKRKSKVAKKAADYMLIPQAIVGDVPYEVRRAVRENGINVGSVSLGVFEGIAAADAAVAADVAAGNRPAQEIIDPPEGWSRW